MIRSIHQSRDNYSFIISAITWRKNYHNLFDYEETQTKNFFTFKEQIQAKQTYFLIFRNRQTMQMTLEQKKKMKKIRIEDIQGDKSLICGGKVIIKDKYFQIKFYQPDEVLLESDSEYWLENQHSIVVRSLKNSEKQHLGYKLHPKNIIKIGNRELFIHSIVKDENDYSIFIKKNISEIINLKKKYENSEQKQNPIDYLVCNNQKIYDAGHEKFKQDEECKYCINHDSQVDNDFLCSPCKCTGSCGVVHFQCLVKWNHKKVKKIEQKQFTEYNFQRFFCEVCKEQYPQYIKKDQIIHELLPIERPKGTYMVLQDFYSQKRHVIIIKDAQSLIVGRGNESQLKFEQMTISKRHAEIKKINGDYYIYDLKSKYGTLVKQINLNILLRKDDKFSIQSGNSVITFSLQQKRQSLYPQQ